MRAAGGRSLDLTIRVPAIEMLVDYAASGIGGIAGPMLAPWRARREAVAARVAAGGKADVLTLLAEGQAGALPVIVEAQKNARLQLADVGGSVEAELTIADGLEQRVRFQEEKRQRNIVAILDQAARELATDDVEKHEPDHDWTARFFNEAQDVSSEEIQVLWSRVLAGEVERPGSTSVRTLAILRNLDSSSASLFRKLCSISMSITEEDKCVDMRIPSIGGNAAHNALQKYGLGFNSLNVLNEHGLIIADYNSWFDYKFCIGFYHASAPKQILRIPFCFQNRFWILESLSQRKPDQEFKLSGVALTKSGQELSRVVDLAPMQEYMQDIVAFFAKQGLRMSETKAKQMHTIAP